MSKIYEALRKAEKEKGDERRGDLLQSTALQVKPSGKGDISSLSVEAAEEYRKMLNSITSRDPGQDVRALAMISSVQSEGTSSVSAQFARSVALSGQQKVLLVDANLRHPVLHDLFARERENGLVEVAQGIHLPGEVVKETETPSLSVVTAGRPIEDPPLLLGSPRLKEAFSQWRQTFSYLIFDCSPVLAYADAVILGRLIDGVVLVVQAGKTRREVVQKALDTLKNAKVVLLGVVLNRRQYVIPKRVYQRL